jgi:hypothetical protein
MIIKTDKEISQMIDGVHDPLLKFISLKEKQVVVEDDYTEVESLLGELLSGAIIGDKFFKFIPKIIKIITQNIDYCKFFLSVKNKNDIVKFIDSTFSDKMYNSYFVDI